jgi:hypothetical protein
MLVTPISFDPHSTVAIPLEARLPGGVTVYVYFFGVFPEPHVIVLDS